MSLPIFLQPYLASYDLSKIDVEQDKDIIITEILNKGNFEALSWLGKVYTQEEIKQILTSPTKGMWMKSVLSYWLKIFNTKLPRRIFEEAIVNLNPGK